MHEETPAFEVFNADRTKVFRIYASGRTEGFPEDCHIVNNRIHWMVSKAIADERERDQ